MPWVSKKQRDREQAELEKARVPAGARDVSNLVNLMARAQGRDVDLGSRGQPLFRPEEWLYSEFGPNWPLPIEPLDRVRPDVGLPEPRQYQYPVAENLRYFAERLVSWDILKQTADSPLFRACIEIKKAELTTLDWKIQISNDAIESQSRATKRSKQEIEQELRQKYQPEISRISNFWEMPDRRNGRNFAEWLSIAQEEQLVWDAIAIYPRRTFGGELLDFMLIDGSTIKPLLDHQGGRPEPPAPAYQQILYGFPRGEFTADTLDQDGNLIVPGGLLSSQLVYQRRVPRLQTPYGFSSTEQALLDGLLYNRRFEWMLAEYTQGTQPAGWVKLPETYPGTARQVLAMEREFNDRYAGKTSERMRHPFLPPGLELVLGSAIEERYKSDYDLHLIKLVAMHFGLTITELGFTEKGGLGSSGYHEGQEDIQFRKGLLPDSRWFASLLTRISREYLGMPQELEFVFMGLDDEDEAAADAVNENRVKSGRMTINEARVEAGQPPVAIPEADMLQVMTARGVVFEEGASKLAPPGVMIEPASEQEGKMSGGGVAAGNRSIAAPSIKQPKGKKVAKADLSKHTGERTPQDEVYALLSQDYPAHAIQWVHTMAWEGPQEIPLDKMDWTDPLFNEAQTEPGGAERIDKFAQKIDHKESRGKHIKGVVKVQIPGEPLLDTPDGHHRTLAYQKLGRPVWGYIGHASHSHGPWDKMHDFQFTMEQAGDDTAKSMDPADIARELRAYKRWCQNNHGANRPFRFSVLTKELANDLVPEIVKAGNAVFAVDTGPKAP